jgi:hypothetical protein
LPNNSFLKLFGEFDSKPWLSFEFLDDEPLLFTLQTIVVSTRPLVVIPLVVLVLLDVPGAFTKELLPVSLLSLLDTSQSFMVLSELSSQCKF